MTPTRKQWEILQYDARAAAACIRRIVGVAPHFRGLGCMSFCWGVDQDYSTTLAFLDAIVREPIPEEPKTVDVDSLKKALYAEVDRIVKEATK